MKYQRFVAYVYEYRKGKKEENCGFLRVEARNENIKVEIHMKCPGLPVNEKCSIYGFIRKAGLMEGILLGSVRVTEEKIDGILESERAENNLWKEKFPQFGGIIIKTDNGAFFGTEWDDQPIKPENFEKEKVEDNCPEELEEQKKIKEQKNSANQKKTEDQGTQKDQDKDIEIEEITEVQNEIKTKKPYHTHYAERKSEQLSEQSTFCPFNDDEFAECRKIQPNDLFKICPRGCAFRNNRFLEHGYYNFGHLLVGRRSDGQCFLGVPGGYDQQERFMANMFGFPYFKESREILIQGCRGGYWYRLINPSDSDQGNRLFQ